MNNEQTSRTTRVNEDASSDSKPSSGSSSTPPEDGTPASTATTKTTIAADQSTADVNYSVVGPCSAAAGEDKDVNCNSGANNSHLGHFNGFNVSRVKKVKLEGTGKRMQFSFLSLIAGDCGHQNERQNDRE